MIFPFNKEEFLFLKDIERCPFIWGDYKYPLWIKNDDKRQLLIALDRYSKSLICKHEIIKLKSISGIYQMCMKCERTVCFGPLAQW